MKQDGVTAMKILDKEPWLFLIVAGIFLALLATPVTQSYLRLHSLKLTFQGKPVETKQKAEVPLDAQFLVNPEEWSSKAEGTILRKALTGRTKPDHQVDGALPTYLADRDLIRAKTPAGKEARAWVLAAAEKDPQNAYTAIGAWNAAIIDGDIALADRYLDQALQAPEYRSPANEVMRLQAQAMQDRFGNVGSRPQLAFEPKHYDTGVHVKTYLRATKDPEARTKVARLGLRLIREGQDPASIRQGLSLVRQAVLNHSGRVPLSLSDEDLAKFEKETGMKIPLTPQGMRLATNPSTVQNAPGGVGLELGIMFLAVAMLAGAFNVILPQVQPWLKSSDNVWVLGLLLFTASVGKEHPSLVPYYALGVLSLFLLARHYPKAVWPTLVASIVATLIVHFSGIYRLELSLMSFLMCIWISTLETPAWNRFWMGLFLVGIGAATAWSYEPSRWLVLLSVALGTVPLALNTKWEPKVWRGIMLGSMAGYAFAGVISVIEDRDAARYLDLPAAAQNLREQILLGNS